MNAIAGRDLLPVGLLPLTSAITVLKFGPTERLVIQREGTQIPETKPVSALAEFVTQQGNPGNRKRVKTATLEVPLPFLRRGVEFVDTPGAGSPVEANTATTRAFLPECDAALFVTSTDAPLSPGERAFLREVRGHARKIFYVLNKTDLCASERERGELQRALEGTIHDQTGAGEVSVFPVSAKMALESKLHPGDDASADHGLEALEEALSAFLATEKASVLLVAMIDRALHLAGEEWHEIELCEKARSCPSVGREAKLAAICHRFSTLREERKRLFAQLRLRLGDRAMTSLTPVLEAFLTAQRALTMRFIEQTVVRAGWRLGEDCASWCGERVLGKTRSAVDSWLRSHTESLDLASDAVARSLWGAIAANESELPRVAAAVFDLRPLPGQDAVPPFHVELGTAVSALRHFVWNPRCKLSHMLPVALVRRSLKNAFVAEAERMFLTAASDAAAILEAVAEAAVERLEQEVANRVEESEERMVAAINGTRLPRRKPSQGMPPPEEADWGERALASIQEKLRALREQTLHPGSVALAGNTAALGAPPEVQPPKLREASVNIEQRLKTRGCPVCDYLVDLAFNFFAEEQFALYVDENAQAELAATRGFCPLHLWQLHAISSPLSASGGLAHWVEETSKALLRTKAKNDGPRFLPPNADDCRVCQLLRHAEKDFIGGLARFLEDPEQRLRYGHSQGVCLRHLSALVQAIQDEATVKFLYAESARHLEEMAEDMQSYAMKRAAPQTPAPNADENDAAWRALVHLAGSRYVCAPWPPDGEI